jgi:CheY-like chemotaxis protein
MPVMDGLEATRQLRGLETLSGPLRPYIIALTANAMQADSDACFASGMDAYMSKPVTLEALKTEFNTAWRRMEASSGALLGS